MHFKPTKEQLDTFLEICKKLEFNVGKDDLNHSDIIVAEVDNKTLLIMSDSMCQIIFTVRYCSSDFIEFEFSVTPRSHEELFKYLERLVFTTQYEETSKLQPLRFNKFVEKFKD